MRIVAAIGGSILIKTYDAQRFQEYSDILKDLSKEHEIFGLGIFCARFEEIFRIFFAGALADGTTAVKGEPLVGAAARNLIADDVF